MNLKLLKPSTTSEKQTHTTMDTIELFPKLVASWKSPLFQRDLKMNGKVIAVAEEIKRNGGVLPGIITIGVLDNETYIVDGQHRLGAFLQTALPMGYADVRTHWFESLAKMAEEFVRLNSQLVKLRPDDILRGMEPSTEALQRIRRKCGYIGYDAVRRSQKGPVVSMSVFVRSWAATRVEVPATSGASALSAVGTMDDAETTAAIDCAGLCFEAWKRDYEYARLWGRLNLTLCMWLFRRIVLGERMTTASRAARLTRDEFRRCLLALSADKGYLEYLVGRNLSDRDRGPTYNQIKALFQRRYLTDTGKSIRLPSPPWSHS